MTWFLFALATALFSACRDFFSKQNAKNINPLIVSWSLSLFSVPFLALGVLFIEVPPITMQFVIWVSIASVLLATAWILYVRALDASDLSLTIPIVAIVPVVLLVLEPLLLGEVPTTTGTLGVLLVAGGIYITAVSRGSKGLLAPFRALLSERGPKIMFVASLIMCGLAITEKKCVLTTHPLFFALVESIIVAIIMAPIVFRQESEAHKIVVQNLSRLIPLGFFIAMMFACQYTAMKLGPVVYVISVKRLSILFGVLAGCLFLGEEQLGKRLSGAVVIVIGVLLIALA